MRVVERAEDARGGARGGVARGGSRVRRRHRLLRALPRAGRATSRCSSSATASGTVLALGERDCSVQRRHQKVVEETPPPGLSPRPCAHGIADAAVAFARRARLRERGHGRVPGRGRRAFFLELNARIQVEHPVTEAVTGLDLVELQLRVADGESLADLVPSLTGHAVEARLYAGGPAHVPAAGRARFGGCAFPAGARVDAGVEEGDEVGGSYDPMIAKLIVHGGRSRRRARPARRRARRDGRRRGRHEPAVPALARRAPGVPRRRPVDRLPRRDFPPLSAPPGPLPPARWRRAGGSTWRRRAPLPPLEVESAAHAGTQSRRRRARHRPMPGKVIERSRRDRRAGRAASTARRPGGDEDGAAGRRPRTRQASGRSTSRSATRSATGACSSS